MVSRYFRLSILLIILFPLGCDPIELPEPQTDEPVFTLIGELGGDTFDLAAGVDQYFMFTDAYSAGGDQFVAEGRLAELDCNSNCRPSWRFEFQGEPNQIINMLNSDTVNYAKPDSTAFDTTYRLNLMASTTHLLNEDVWQYRWYLNDSLADTAPSLSIPAQIDEEYLVSLETLTEDSCYSYSERTIGVSAQSLQCEANFNIDPNSLIQTIVATAEPSGQLPASYVWLDSISGTNSITIAPIPANPITICLDATYADGCTARSCQSVLPNTVTLSPATCSNKIIAEQETDTTIVTFPGLAEGVSIYHQDENGMTYQSNTGQQAALSYFRILNTSPFENNAAGQATIMIDVAFECQLFDEDGTPWKTVRAEGVIAVATP